MAEDGSVVIKIFGDDNPFRKTLGSLAKASTAAIAGAGSALAGLGAYAVKVGSEFESSMSQVAATMGMTTEEIHNGSEAYETLATAAKNAGATTKFTATQAADALNYLALAGYDAATSAEVLPSVLNLAAAGGLELAYASDLATDAMAALGIEASAANLTKFGDQMAMASSKANYSVAQLGEAILTVGGTAKNLAGGTVELNTALGVLANRGIKGAEGGTALRNMILSLSAPTDKAAATMKSLGVSAFDAEGNLRPLNAVFKDLDAAMRNLSGEEKTNILNDIFNKVDLKSAEAMLAGCGEEFDNLAEAITNSDDAMQNMADVQMDNLKGQITLLQSAVEGLGVALYENIDGTIKDAVGAAAGYVSELNAVMGAAFADTENVENVEKVTKALVELGYSAEEADALVGTGMNGVVSSLGDILAQALSDIANAAPALLDAGTQLIAAFLQGIQENGDSLAEGALSIVGTLGKGIVELLPMIADTAASLMVSLADGLKENLPEMVPAAVETIASLVENLTSNADTILQAGIDIILALGQGIINAIPQLIEKIPEIVINIANVINDNAPRLMDAALYIITRFAVGLLHALPVIKENIPKIIEAIVAAFMAFQWLNFGKKLIDGIANGVKKAGESMAKAAKETFAKFKGKLTGSEIATELKNIGKYIIDGIVGGIKNGFKSIGDVAVKLKDTLLSKLKSLFKINSPSKLMRDEVGKSVGEGIAVGITESGQKAVDAAENVADGIVSAMARTETAVGAAKKVATQVGYAIENQMKIANTEILRIQREAEEERAAEELKQYQENLAKKQAELKKAEKKNRQKILEEIAKIESDWNKRQAETAKKAEQEKLQARISSLNEFKTKMEEFQREYESSLSAIESKQKSLGDKLSDYGSLFTRSKDEDTGKEIFKLENLDESIKKIQKYNEQIEELKKKGISDGLLAEISGMNIDDALDFTKKLDELTPQKFDEYVAKYEEKQRLANETAKNFYSNELDELEKSTLKQMEGFSNDFVNVGEMLTAGVAEGIENGESGLVNTIAKVLRAAVRAAKEEMDIHSPSRVMAEIGDYMAQGIGVGWSDRMETVTDTIGSSLSDGLERKMTNAYARMKATMQDGMQKLTSDIAVQARGATNYTTTTTTHQEGDTILQIEHFHNDSKEAVPSLMQEMEFARRRKAVAKGGE